MLFAINFASAENTFHIYIFLEVYAAREKNGIYIPKDRYLQEEAEKKVFFFSQN